MNRCDARQCILLLATVATFLGICVPAEAAPADAYVLEPKRGRTMPEREMRPPGEANWAFTVVGGLSAAGDLFQVKNDLTMAWTAPITGEPFQAQRFTVTLDESLLVGFALARRVTGRGWLWAAFSWTEMDATALANDTQFVTLVPFDTLTLTKFGLGWEQRLLDTPLSPFLSAGLSYLDVSAKATYLSQTLLAPRLGVGVCYDLSGAWRLRGEISDIYIQLESDEITGVNWPQNAAYRELGPQHLIGLSLGLAVYF